MIERCAPESPVIAAGSSAPSESIDATGLPVVGEANEGVGVGAHHLLADTAPPLRPGVTNQTLRDNEVSITGLGRTSYDLKIPYFSFDGAENGRYPVDDGKGGDFYRERLDRPASEGGKYSQPSGTPACAYFPVGLADLLRRHRYVIITEGEFKALSLVEAGYPAVAIGGIYNFRQDGLLLPELVELFQCMDSGCCGCEAIHFLGDADTAINGQFSDAVVKLRDALSAAHIDAPLLLPRMSAGEMHVRKGIDDARADMAPEAFGPYLDILLGSALTVTPDIAAKDLMMVLFEHHREGIVELIEATGPVDKPKLKEKLARLANLAGGEGADELADFAVEHGLCKKKSHFKQAMKDQAKKLAEEMDRKRERKRAPVFYCPSGSKNYLYEGNSGFVRVDRTGALNYLHEQGHSKKAAGPGELSEAERQLTKAEKAAVDWTGPLAGRKMNFYVDNGLRLLVTRSPELLAPVGGESWDTIRDFIETRLDYDPALDPSAEKQAVRAKTQSPYFYGWLSRAAQSLYLNGGKFEPSQALVLCGAASGGKNTLQELLTALLGNRHADPFDYIEGSSGFNGELAGAEHWMIADKQSSAKHTDREKMKSCMKQACVNRTMQINAKHQHPISVEIWRRLSISLNHSPECLRVLPSLSSDFADKLMIFHVLGRPFHGEGTDFATFQAWWEQITAELPAFLHHLLRHRVEPAMASLRYGVEAYHDPEIVQRMHEQSQEGRLVEILDMFLRITDRKAYERTAKEVQNEIWPEGSEELRSIGCDSALKMGTLLTKLVEQMPERFSSRIRSGNKLYLIRPRIASPCEAEVCAAEVDVTSTSEMETQAA